MRCRSFLSSLAVLVVAIAMAAAPLGAHSDADANAASDSGLAYILSATCLGLGDGDSGKVGDSGGLVCGGCVSGCSYGCGLACGSAETLRVFPAADDFALAAGHDPGRWLSDLTRARSPPLA